ncbi:hypothetical protein FG386_003229 [Cryptosporidium ryanae]|uniref:uncharacterized protein n=1 Tax=Cryptosporidium ryanae TaxID=515981 RepID=UPI00351A9890|nr:hypothetical protein FG386_003229 [Cryptosporidium ryanae]
MLNKHLEEEERGIYQVADLKGKNKECCKRNKYGTDEEEFREINPIFGCLIPCLKCCIYPCRAFFLTGRRMAKKRRDKKKRRFESRKNQNNNFYSNNIQNTKPHYNQFYSASSNIGNCVQNSHNHNNDTSTRPNMRHPQMNGNCITPICSGTSASFCTIQAEYPQNRRSALPSSSSYGQRRYVENYLDDSRDSSESNKLIYCCLGNNSEELTESYRGELERHSSESLGEKCNLKDFNENNYQDIHSNDVIYEGGDSFNDYDNYNYYQELEKYQLLREEKKDNFNNTIFSSCMPCNYSDVVNSKYNQGTCFVDN